MDANEFVAYINNERYDKTKIREIIAGMDRCAKPRLKPIIQKHTSILKYEDGENYLTEQIKSLDKEQQTHGCSYIPDNSYLKKHSIENIIQDGMLNLVKETGIGENINRFNALKIDKDHQMFSTIENLVKEVILDIVLKTDELNWLKKQLEKLRATEPEFIPKEEMPERQKVDREKATKIKKRSKETSFRNIIQYEDPYKFMERLHQLIDNKSGADVGSVLLRAKLENYITRNPTQKEFESEFTLIGGWSAIKNYLDDNNQTALDRANKVVFFK